MRFETRSVELFQTKIEKAPNGCHLWRGDVIKGRGRMTMRIVGGGSLTMKSHRIAWILATGAEPPDLWPFWSCGDRLCCNPGHLRFGKQQERAKTLAERFEAKVDRSGGPDACHLWTGSRKRSERGKGLPHDRYGSIGVAGSSWKTWKSRPAHCVAWELANGAIPEGLLVCHHCDNEGCVNVRHLFLGTQADNMADMIAKDRGVQPLGEEHWKAKITGEIATAIRAEYRNKRTRQVDLAARYRISQATISAVLRRTIWKHVE